MTAELWLKRLKAYWNVPRHFGVMTNIVHTHILPNRLAIHNHKKVYLSAKDIAGGRLSFQNLKTKSQSVREIKNKKLPKIEGDVAAIWQLNLTGLLFKFGHCRSTCSTCCLIGTHHHSLHLCSSCSSLSSTYRKPQGEQEKDTQKTLKRTRSTRRTLACRCRGVAAIKHMIVEQFGFAIRAPFLLLNLIWDMASEFTCLKNSVQEGAIVSKIMIQTNLTMIPDSQTQVLVLKCHLPHSMTLTSGITRGMFSSMRNAELLSTTIDPWFTAIGPNFLLKPKVDCNIKT